MCSARHDPVVRLTTVKRRLTVGRDQGLHEQEAERFFDQGDASALPASRAEKISDVLAALDTAAEPSDVGLFPGWRLHPLKGDLKGFWSVTITGNWRVIFRFVDGDVFDVDMLDYH